MFEVVVSPEVSYLLMRRIRLFRVLLKYLNDNIRLLRIHKCEIVWTISSLVSKWFTTSRLLPIVKVVSTVARKPNVTANFPADSVEIPTVSPHLGVSFATKILKGCYVLQAGILNVWNKFFFYCITIIAIIIIVITESEVHMNLFNDMQRESRNSSQTWKSQYLVYYIRLFYFHLQISIYNEPRDSFRIYLRRFKRF